MSKRPIAICLILLLFLGSLTPIEQSLASNSNYDNGNEWPMFHHDPQHTGYIKSKAPSNNNVRWSKKISSVYLISAVVRNKVLFTVSDENIVYALDTYNGREIWNFNMGNSRYAHRPVSPAIYNDILVVGSLDGKIYGVNIKNGEEIWRFETLNSYGNNVISPPTIEGSMTYIGGRTCGMRLDLPNYTIPNKVYALDTYTGKEIWNYTTIDDASSPTVTNGKVFFESHGKIYALDKYRGVELWNFSAHGPIITKNDLIYVTNSHENPLYALDQSTGSILWKSSSGSMGVRIDDMVANDEVIITSSSGRIFAVNITSGEELWNFGTGYGMNYLALADDDVVVGSSQLFILDIADGNIIWSYNVSVEGLKSHHYLWFSPAIANGVIFVGAGNGMLYAFGESNIIIIILSMVIGTAIIVALILRGRKMKGKRNKIGE